ncbi:MAG: hypothetical protein ACFFEV_04700 [Candidatus Thorarchaeota archaeon]
MTEPQNSANNESLGSWITWWLALFAISSLLRILFDVIYAFVPTGPITSFSRTIFSLLLELLSTVSLLFLLYLIFADVKK